VNPSDNHTADVSPAAVAKLLASGAVIVVDVREPEEWTAGHIDGAVLIPLGTLNPVTIATIDGSKPVVAVCRSGKRSARAAQILRAAGLTVHNMTGGMNDWARVGLPVHTAPGTAGSLR
jgi:rhodanese-related sulfurtransferase